MRRPVFVNCALVVLFAVSSLCGQQGSCRVDLPVGIIDAQGNLLHGLAASDVTIHIRKQAVPVDAVTYDTGPRRVLFILDTGRRLAPEARKAETMLVSYVLDHARNGDSFALLTTRGMARRVGFDEDRGRIVNALKEITAEPKETAKAPNILDTMMDGVQLFGQPRPGDAILILADHLEGTLSGTSSTGRYQPRNVSGTGPMQGVVQDTGNQFEESSRAKFSSVSEALADHRIRTFGLQLGAVNIGLNTAHGHGEENMFSISLDSGGYAVLDGTDAYGSYVMTDARAKDLQHKVFQLYGAIAEFYILRVNAPVPLHREQWKLDLAKDLQKNTRALHPEFFDPCGSQ